VFVKNGQYLHFDTSASLLRLRSAHRSTPQYGTVHRSTAQCREDQYIVFTEILRLFNSFNILISYKGTVTLIR